jgi:hypothetical protein
MQNEAYLSTYLANQDQAGRSVLLLHAAKLQPVASTRKNQCFVSVAITC